MKAKSKRMSRRAVGVLSGLVVLLTMTDGAITSEGEMINAPPTRPPVTYEIPFKGPGQLATIWSVGDMTPYSGVLVVANREGHRLLEVEALSRVRWRSPTELMVDQSVLPRKGLFGNRIGRIDRQGKVLEVLTDREGLIDPQPAPGGRLLAVQRVDAKGVGSLEVRDLDEAFKLVSEHPASPSLHLIGGGVVWSPDGRRLVVASWLDAPEHRGTLYPRLTLIGRDDPTSLKRVPDGPAGTDAETGGIVPLFWNERGIYGRSNRGLLRCDPQGTGCELLYTPGKDRFVFAGAALGSGQALLLVQDPSLNPFEVRAKEIHQVDLATGKGSVLLRLPDGVFINDIDWIADADS